MENIPNKANRKKDLRMTIQGFDGDEIGYRCKCKLESESHCKAATDAAKTKPITIQRNK